MLAGVHPQGGWWGVAGTLAVVVASVSYAVGSLWGQRLIARTSGLVLSASSMLGGLLVLIPFGLWQLPSEVPGWKETGSVIALAVIGTALAQIILYRVLRSDGAARVSLVTYLLPVTALIYGVLLLGEPLTWEELAGMALILGGVALGSGAVRFAAARAGRRALAVNVTLRRAEPRDVDFLLELMTHEDVDPYMAVVRPRDREGLLEEIERSQAEPEEYGRFVIEVDGEPAGLMGFQVANKRSRIANLGSLAVHPVLPRPAPGRRGRAALPAPPDLRPRLPPAAARDLRLQRARAAARRAGGLRQRRRTPKGVRPPRRVGRRRDLRARARGPGAVDRG